MLLVRALIVLEYAESGILQNGIFPLAGGKGWRGDFALRLTPLWVMPEPIIPVYVLYCTINAQ